MDGLGAAGSSSLAALKGAALQPPWPGPGVVGQTLPWPPEREAGHAQKLDKQMMPVATGTEGAEFQRFKRALGWTEQDESCRGDARHVLHAVRWHCLLMSQHKAGRALPGSVPGT